MEELKPYNEASKAQRAEKTNFDSRWSDLDFKNEQQLDETIASIDYRLSHETNSVADERKLIAELKKLGVWPSLHADLWYLLRAGRHWPSSVWQADSTPSTLCTTWSPRTAILCCGLEVVLLRFSSLRMRMVLRSICVWSFGAGRMSLSGKCSLALLSSA